MNEYLVTESMLRSIYNLGVDRGKSGANIEFSVPPNWKPFKLSEQLEPLITYLYEEHRGICPYTAFQVNIDCDNCTYGYDVTKCWREYFDRCL